MSLNNAGLAELVAAIGKTVYEQSEALPDEEKWGIQTKLRSRVGDVITWTAEALGSIDPRDAKWAFGKAQASLFVVEAAYKHACTVGLLKLDPDLMVKIGQARKEISELINKATREIPAWFKEMEPPVKKGVKL